MAVVEACCHQLLPCGVSVPQRVGGDAQSVPHSRRSTARGAAYLPARLVQLPVQMCWWCQTEVTEYRK